MRLFKMELYKIVKRPASLALSLLLGMILFHVWGNNIQDARTEIDGKVYTGLEAIRKDQELAEAYSGKFTMEKAEEIAEKYGFSGPWERDGSSYYRKGNYCSQFITDHMTDFPWTEEEPDGFLQGQEYEDNVKYLVDGTKEFGYVRGWDDLSEFMNVVNLLISIWIILVLAPVFSEEYGLGTVRVLLTTAHGKSKAVFLKIAAALFWGLAVYLGISLSMFLMYLGIYGTAGLGASAALISAEALGLTVLEYLGKVLLFGTAALVLNMCLTLLISALCKKSAVSVVWGILLYLAPFMLWKLMEQMGGVLMSTGLGMEVIRIVRILCMSMPMYLCRLELSQLAVIGTPWVIMIAAFVTGSILVSVFWSFHHYRNYQQ